MAAKYDEMILDMKKIAICFLNLSLRGVAPGFCLLDFLISPSTYASMQRSDVLKQVSGLSGSLMSTACNFPLIYVAACLIATVACLSWKEKNHVWVSRYIIL